MNKHKKRHPGSMLLIVLVLAALLGACGAEQPTGSTTGTVSGIVTVGTPTVGLKTCTSCHPVPTADWMLTKHANVEPSGNLYSAGNPTIGEISGCTKMCHDPQGDSGQLVAGYTGNAIRPVVGCESCHGGGSLHAANGGIGPIGYAAYTAGVISGATSSVQVSAQFATCTSCHELLDADDPVNTAATPSHMTALPPTGSAYIITDTHFATPGDWTGIGSAGTISITGYSMSYRDAQGNYKRDYSDEKVCVNCHNPHKPPTQNREWAQSAHADKNPFNLNSTGTGYFSGAWAHYAWGTNSYRACQRCHTTTGFTAYADALRSGDTTLASNINSGLITLIPGATPTNWEPEMLKCNGCHTDNKGTLRNPGAIAANYDYVSGGKTYAKASHVYPDLAGSNVCMACHTGRESGDTVRGLNDPALLSAGTITFFDFSNMGFINSHYLTAGGQVFTVTGYEFPGRPYNNIAEYLHDKIGTADTQKLPPYVNTGSDGPCIGCHMSRPNKNGNHLFLPVSRSTTSIGLITGIASEVCFNCHGPSTTLILDLVREQKAQFFESIEVLKDELGTKLGIYFAPYNPYYFIAPGFDTLYNQATTSTCVQSSNLPVKNWQTGGTSTFTPTQNATTLVWSCVSATDIAGVPGTGQNNMGAAYNFNLLEHDPGAYVHNRMYTKRLIYDSLDWVDDNIMNYSVGATLTAACSVASPPVYCAEAPIYLLPNGVLWNGTYPDGNGIEAERP